MVCPIPTAKTEMSINGDIASGKITTIPGLNEEIIRGTLFVYNGNRYYERPDVDLTGPSQDITFTWEIENIEGPVYFQVLLVNSCDNMSDWIKGEPSTKPNEIWWYLLILILILLMIRG